MHQGIKDYVEKFKYLHKKGDYVLEVGSLNVNGTIRDVFPIGVGVDMREGRDVDHVCSGEDLPFLFLDDGFEGVVSCETLEHVRNWREFLQGIWTVLDDDGYFICTLASLKKKRHAYPDDYWRLEEHHVREIFEGQEIIDITPNLGVSFGFVVRKKTELRDLKDIKLIPVDNQVPEELL